MTAQGNFALALGVVMVHAMGQQGCLKAQSGLEQGKRFSAPDLLLADSQACIALIIC